MSSYSSSSHGSASICCDSYSTMSTTSSSVPTIPKKVPCFFDPLTCKRQSFSIPEKIIYYIAKNCKNAKTFQKLVETCKYFFKVNPIIVVYRLECYGGTWYAYYDEDGKYRFGFKYDQPINGKIWITEKFICVSEDASKLIPLVYKNDATFVFLRGESLKFDEFLFIAANAKEVKMLVQLIKYENGEVVQFEDIVKNLPKLQSFTCIPDYGDESDINTNTATRLIEIEHFKRISRLKMENVPEELNVEIMFNFIIENQQIEVDLFYREEISDACKELIREYSNRLKNEEGCKSRIEFEAYGTTQTSSLEDDISDISFDSIDNLSDDDEKEDLLFPWKNDEDEEWELPWNKIE